ncbi:DUF551 domain-containing protein [Yokenella regensburgei]|uniref:DUF551 domain-containing protein n=1 Tax=Yokenella regensburgei TaxID=158877 RepID=UPI003F17297F
MTTQLSKERLAHIANFHRAMTLPPSHEEIEAMARALLAAYEQEPVAYRIGGYYLMHAADPKVDNYSSAEPLYTHPAPSIPAAVPEVRNFNFDDFMFGVRRNPPFRGETLADNLKDDAVALIEEAFRAAMLQATPRSDERLMEVPTDSEMLLEIEGIIARDDWIPVSERLPDAGEVVLVYTPPQPGEYPGGNRIEFDYIDPDSDDPTYWFAHGENYEHFCMVACDGMTGPTEHAPYTHWQPLPAPPKGV